MSRRDPKEPAAAPVVVGVVTEDDVVLHGAQEILGPAGVAVRALHPRDAEPAPEELGSVLLIDERGGPDLAKRVREWLGDRPPPPALLLLEGDVTPPAVPPAEAHAFDFEREPFHWPSIRQRLLQLVAVASRLASAEREQRVSEVVRDLCGVDAWTLDREGCVVRHAMGGASEAVGRSVLGRDEAFRLFEALPKEEHEQIRQAIASLDAGETVELEHRVNGTSGGPRLVQHRIARTGCGETSIVGAVRDVTGERSTLARLETLAHYDSLTGLTTRARFLAALTEVFATLGPDEPISLLYIDLDGFKRVNDRFGHWTGDQLLREAADRLRSALRASDAIPPVEREIDRPVLGRMGGDEFIVLLPRIERERAELVARRILDAHHEPFVLTDRQLRISPSVGIAVAPEDGRTPAELVRHADLAMYEAKSDGGARFASYRGSVGRELTRRLRVEEALQHALDRDELSVCFQPRIDVRSGRACGAEALLRWTSFELGSVSPGEFIPVAEETGLIVPIGEWVLETVCRQARAFETAIPGRVRYSINVSGRQFLEPDLAGRLAGIVANADIDPNLLEIEVTETVAIRRPAEAKRVLGQLREAGIEAALDDFGTGYSSLSMLLELPLDCLKLDRSIVQGIHRNPDAASVAQAMILMAHSLGLRVVAEGVEESAQLDLLASLDCDEAQGFLFAPALPPVEFIALANRMSRD